MEPGQLQGSDSLGCCQHSSSRTTNQPYTILQLLRFRHAPETKANSPALLGAGKSNRASRASTPGSSVWQSTAGDDLDETPDGPDELSKLIDKNARKFDISNFPYTLTPGITDMASRYFEPAQKRDFTALPLKPDHENLPLWIDGWGKIILKNFHWQATRVQDFLITVAEPTSRPTFMHEYKLTIHSLYAAVSVGLSTKDIVNTLERFSKNGLPPNIAEFITECGKSYRKVKLVLRNTKYFLETTDRALLQRLLRDPEISACRVQGAEATRTTAPTMAGLTIAGTKEAAGLREAAGLDPRKSVPETSGHGGTAEDMYGILNDDDDDDGNNADITHAFEIKDDKVSTVAARCLAL
ncbi:hypothetical protein VTI28DRAFT_5505 [Corynascus sepedonium]